MRHVIFSDRNFFLIAFISLISALGLLSDVSPKGQVPKPCKNMVKHNWEIRCDGEGDFAGARLFLDAQKMDLNQVSKRDLSKIHRLSKKTAERIVEVRNRLGNFKSFKEVLAVKGVGPKTLNRLKQKTFIVES